MYGEEVCVSLLRIIVTSNLYFSHPEGSFSDEHRLGNIIYFRNTSHNNVAARKFLAYQVVHGTGNG